MSDYPNNRKKRRVMYYAKQLEKAYTEHQKALRTANRTALNLFANDTCQNIMNIILDQLSHSDVRTLRYVVRSKYVLKYMRMNSVVSIPHGRWLPSEWVGTIRHLLIEDIARLCNEDFQNLNLISLKIYGRYNSDRHLSHCHSIKNLRVRFLHIEYTALAFSGNSPLEVIYADQNTKLEFAECTFENLRVLHIDTFNDVSGLQNINVPQLEKLHVRQNINCIPVGISTNLKELKCCVYTDVEFKMDQFPNLEILIDINFPQPLGKKIIPNKKLKRVICHEDRGLNIDPKLIVIKNMYAWRDRPSQYQEKYLPAGNRIHY